MDSPRHTTGPDKEVTQVSLKEIVIKANEWIAYLWKKKWLIILFGLIGGGLGIGYSFIKEPEYKAELTFVLEDAQPGGLSGLGGIANQLGFDLGGIGGGSGAFTGDNIMQLLQSRLLVEKSLLNGTIQLEGKQVPLAEYYIESNEMRKKWEKRPDLKELHYPLHADRSKFTFHQDSVLGGIQGELVKKNLKIEKPDKKLTFISVACINKDELFAKAFVEELVKQATDFYVDTKTKRNKVNVDRLQLQADSIENELNRKTYSAARVQDLNANPARQIASVGTELALRDKMVLQTMFAEVVKNLELAKIAMAQESPIIQIVDRPILPLEKRKFGKLKGLVFGGFVGGILTIMFLVFRRGLKQLLS